MRNEKVKVLTTLLNGDITVTSSVGKGTTFIVSIPFSGNPVSCVRPD